MSQIIVKTDYVKGLTGSVGQNIVKVSDIKSNLSSLRHTIDGKILSRRNLNSRINSVQQSLQSIHTNLQDLNTFINRSVDSYLRTENKLVHRSSAIVKGNAKRSSYTFDKGIGHSVGKDVQALVGMKDKRWDHKITSVLGNDLVGLVEDFIFYGAAGALKLLPRFKVDGKYVKLLNSQYYKGGQGLARWYTVDNIKEGKYPKATKFYNMTRGLNVVDKIGKYAPFLAAGAVAYDEITTTEKISTTRKVTNAAVVAGEVLVAAKVGATVGGAIGSIIPGAGTVAGAVIGAAVAAGATYVTHKLLKDWKIWDGGKKSTVDVAKDVVGNAAEKTVNAVKGVAKWVGNLFDSKPKPKTGAIGAAGAG